MSLRLITLASVAAQAIAGSIVHEKRDLGSIEPWVKLDRVAPHVNLPVRIGLKQNAYAMDNAHDWLMEVSDPESEKYGQHWTQDDVIAAFQPTDKSVEEVMRWLEETGSISRDRVTHTDNKAWLALDATTAELEELLETQYYEHSHSHTGHSMISCDEYRIPQHLQEHIDYITPGVKGIRVASKELEKRRIQDRSLHGRRPKHIPSSYMPHPGNQLKTCDIVITPACLQALYQFEAPDPKKPVSSNNSLGIFEAGSYYSQKDLNSLFTNFTSIPNGTHPIYDSIDGGVGPVPAKKAGNEADLDFQIAIPILYPQTTTLYATDDAFYAGGGSPTASGIFNTFLDALDGSYCTYSAFGETGNDPVLDPTYPDPNKGGYKGKLMCGTYKPTNVITISYGEQEISLPAYYQQRQCNEYLKLGLQGVSIFVASGDTGVGGYPGGGAASNGCLKTGKVFSPTQPNSCPYLTNVGATKVYPNHTVYEPESAANDPAGHPYQNAYSSSGGFSNLFTAPKYQQAAIATYFKDHNPPYPYYTNGNYTNSDGVYNRNGRGIPDVAANGDNIVSYLGGDYGFSGGTSASSPIFASLVNRIIEERIRVGKGPVGFINPVLYKHPGVLNDITNGTNPGCDTEGFSAVKGWDPVTGLGTPNYPKMLKLFLSLP